MATITVKDAAGVDRQLEAPNANGRQNAAGSRPVALSDEDLAAINAITTAIGDISPGGGSGGDASAENQLTAIDVLGDIDQKLGGSLAVTGDFFPTTQPVSGTVGVSGPVAVTGTFWQATQPVSAASLPLPTGAATATKQDEAQAAISTVGTRSYGTAATRVAYSGASAQSAAIAASEVLVHNCGEGRCFVQAAADPTATTNDIPLEPGEKFHLRITSGHKVAVIQDDAAGNLNVVPVA